MERNWRQQRRPLAGSFKLQASLCTTDIAEEMGSSEVAIATLGSGWGLAKKGREGKGKSRARERLANANQIRQGSLPCVCLGPLPCLPLATSANIKKASPHQAPFSSSVMVPPPHTHTYHQSGPPQLPKCPPIPLSSATPLFCYSTPSCIRQPQTSKNGSNGSLQHLRSSPPPTRTTFNPTLGRFPPNPHVPPPPPLQALYLHPSPLSPSHPAPVP